MTTIMLWPDLHREDGHWLPAVSLAKSLHDRGYTMKMMGIPDTEAIVTPYQIPFTVILSDLFPLGHARERLETGKSDLSHLSAFARGALDSVFTGTSPPDLLIAGYFASLEALILHHKYGIPLVLLTTFLRHPQLTPQSFAHSALLSLAPAVAAKFISLATENASMSIETFVEPLASVPELIAMPEEFDFTDDDWNHDATVHYVEPMVTRVRLDGTPVPPSEVSYINPPPPTGKLLYGAAGSQVEVFESSARQFFTNLLDMMKAPGMSSRHLVLSLGLTLFREFSDLYHHPTGGTGPRPLPDNVSLAPWVPQQDILARAETVFLHGGLATIKESIWAGVPIVITPMVNDQFENALRLENQDLGVLADLRRLSPDNLRGALNQVTSSPWFGRATARMRQIFIDAENRVPKRSVEIVEGIVAP